MSERTTPGEVLEQAQRRRTFAVISHPHAGKSTLTGALALLARVIGQAGAVHGKAGRRGTVSDWAALQFQYGPASGEKAGINLLDTSDHADFPEDTYRVLAAVDAAPATSATGQPTSSMHSPAAWSRSVVHSRLCTSPARGGCRPSANSSRPASLAAR